MHINLIKEEILKGLEKICLVFLNCSIILLYPIIFLLSKINISNFINKFKTTQIKEDFSGWVEWFAWRPIKTEYGTWVWLKQVRCFRCRNIIIDFFYTKEEYIVAKLSGKAGTFSPLIGDEYIDDDDDDYDHY